MKTPQPVPWSGAAAAFVAALVLAGWVFAQGGPRGLKAGQEAGGPWWMRQTALAADGTFPSLKGRRWWRRAAALRRGQTLVIAEREPQSRMMLRREVLRSDPAGAQEGLVWMIDDNADGSLAQGGDRFDDCYLLDFGADGRVDRLVDYIDGDGDHVPEEMECRVFSAGRLNYAWFAVAPPGRDLPDEWRGYDFEPGALFAARSKGDVLIFINKFNSEKGVWSPAGPCPAAFYDPDGDGWPAVALRMTALPLALDPLDPASEAAFSRPWESRMADVGAVSLVASYMIGRGPKPEAVPGYDLSFTLFGRVQYDFPNMAHSNGRRRPPQETVVVPWSDGQGIAADFPARETGLSWREGGDEEAPAAASESEGATNGQGLFWLNGRRHLGPAAGPATPWNVRREWTGKPAAERELYYSEVDRRIHLFGAEEGWLPIGRFAGLGPLGEIRMFDTDKNGFFDRWELFLAASVRPVRITQVRDERARRISADPGELAKFYTTEVLPLARSENERLIAALNELHPFDIPAGLRAAQTRGTESERRYAQDVLRELAYQGFRDYFSTLANQVLAGERGEIAPRRPTGARGGRSGAAADPTAAAWKLARLLDELDLAYGQGDYDRARGIVDEIKKLGRLE
jgi:hypothetical protein